MRGLVVEEVCGNDGLQALRPEWQALFGVADTQPFLSWEWISAWQEAFGHGRTPRVLCARACGKLVGLLALSVEHWRPGRLSAHLRRLCFLGGGSGGADYLDVLALPGCEQEVAGALFAHLAQDDSFDLLDLDGLAADSPSLPVLAWRFGENASFRMQISPRSICPQLKIEGDWADVLKRSRRANYFNYCLRRLHKLPGFDFRVVQCAEQAGTAFERFLELHETRWAGRGGSSATGHPTLRAFHRDVVVQLARAGLLRLEQIWIEGACRAALYGIGTGERYCFYLSGCDPAWAKYSLGFTVIGLSIANAVSRGVKHYDFLRGAEAYKFDWANGTRATVAVEVISHSLPAKLLFAREQVAVAARTLLPEPALALLRRLRRMRASGKK